MGAPASNTTTMDVDPAIRSRILGLYGDAENYLTNTPYQPYLGQGVAGFQPFQNAAMSWLSQGLTGQNIGYSSPTTYGPFGYTGYSPSSGTYVGGGTNSGGDAPETPDDFDDQAEGTREPNTGKGPKAYTQMNAPWMTSYTGQGYQTMDPGVEPSGLPPGANPGDWKGGVQPIGAYTPGVRGAEYNPNVANPYGPMSGMQEGIDAAGGARAGMAYQAAAGHSGIGNYTNPYEDQVVKQAQADMLLAEQQARAAGLGSAGSSAYGGRRGELVQEAMNRDYLDRSAAMTSQLRSQGFNTAAQLAQQDANRALQGAGLNLSAAQALSGIGSQNLSNLLTGANALMGMGDRAQQQAQNTIDYDIGQYDAARNDPMRRYGLLQGILQGMPVGYSQSTTTRPNLGSQIGGGLLGLVGSLGMGGAFNRFF